MKSFFLETIKGTFFLTFWNTANKFVGFINSFAIIYILSVYEYGLYVLVLSVVSMAEVALTESTDQLMATEILMSKGRGDDERAKKIYQEYFLVKTLLTILTFAVLFLGAGFIVRQFFNKSIVLFVKLASFLVLTSGLSDCLNIHIKVEKKFSQMGSFVLVKELVKLAALLIIVFYFKAGIAKVIFTMILADWAGIAALIAYNSRDLRVWFKGFRFNFKNLIVWQIIKAHGKWNIFSSSVAKLQKNLRPWLVQIFINTEAVAIYNFGKNLYLHLESFLPVQKVIYQLLPEINRQQERLKRVFIYGGKYISLILILINLAGLMIVPYFIILVFPKYLASIPVFLIFLAAPFSYFGLSQVASSILFSLRQQKYLAYTQGLATFSLIIFSSLFLPVFGVYGMALEKVATMFITALLVCFKTARLLNLKLTAVFEFFRFTSYDALILKNLADKTYNKLLRVLKIRKV